MGKLPAFGPWHVTICFVVTVGAYVGLAVTNHDTAGLVGAVVTLASVLGLGLHQEQRSRAQNDVLTTIQTQTNGVLDKRILDGSKRAMSEVLAEHGLADRRGAPLAVEATIRTDPPPNP